MPLEDIAEGFFRIVARIIFEIVFEILIKGPGHLLLRTLRPRHPPGEAASALLGLAIWAVVIFGVWLVMQEAGSRNNTLPAPAH